MQVFHHTLGDVEMNERTEEGLIREGGMIVI